MTRIRSPARSATEVIARFSLNVTYTIEINRLWSDFFRL